MAIRKNFVLSQMGFWDSKERLGVVSIEKVVAREESREEYCIWATMEETRWRQKLRELWLKEGYRNTGFFHKMVNAHRRRSTLAKVKMNAVCLIEEAKIEVGIVQAFQTLLLEPEEWHPSIRDTSFDALNSLDAMKLEEPFLKE